jgi:hypothetical protein
MGDNLWYVVMDNVIRKHTKVSQQLRSVNWREKSLYYVKLKWKICHAYRQDEGSKGWINARILNTQVIYSKNKQ